MKWSDEYAIGIERIDEDHKMIFRMSEDFRAALDEGLGGEVYALLLENLRIYCRGHFGYEERCMHEHRCPVAQENKEGHAWFLAKLSEFQEKYAESGFDRADARNFLDTIDQWLSSHICNVDVHLKGCMTRK